MNARAKTKTEPVHVPTPLQSGDDLLVANALSFTLPHATFVATIMSTRKIVT